MKISSTFPRYFETEKIHCNTPPCLAAWAKAYTPNIIISDLLTSISQRSIKVMVKPFNLLNYLI